MIKKASSNPPCGRDSEYIIGSFLKSFSIDSKNFEVKWVKTVFLEFLNMLVHMFQVFGDLIRSLRCFIFYLYN